MELIREDYCTMVEIVTISGTRTQIPLLELLEVKSYYRCKGGFISLTPENLRDILAEIIACREEYRNRPVHLSRVDLLSSKFVDFEDHVPLGHSVEEDIITMFATLTKPHIQIEDFFQCGVPLGHYKLGDLSGQVYLTFCAYDNIWYYAGHCFSGCCVDVSKGKTPLDNAYATVLEQLASMKEPEFDPVAEWRESI